MEPPPPMVTPTVSAIRRPAFRRTIDNKILKCGLCVFLSFAVWPFILLLNLPEENDDRMFPDESKEDYMCPQYGCPIYPPEISDEIVQKALIEQQQQQLRASTRKPWQWSRTILHALAFASPVGTLVTYRGESHAVNQDRAFFIRPFRTHQSENCHDPAEESFVLGILDGHGTEGHVVAEYVQHELPRLLATKLNARYCCQTDEWIQQQLKDTFVQVNEELPQNAYQGGCTASVTLRIGSKLFFANAGDSRTILVAVSDANNYNNNQQQQQQQQQKLLEPTILYETRRDKPHLADERARIEQLGGRIHIPPNNPALSRVVVFSKAADPPEDIGLAMSRSLGDWEWKEIGVTAEPIVNVFDLSSLQHNQTHIFVVAASDGLWDLRPKEFFARRFGETFLNHTASLLQTSVETIQRIAPKQGYRDDITVIVAPTLPYNPKGSEILSKS